MFNLNISKSSGINKKNLLRRLGYIAKNQAISKSLDNLINAVIDLASILAQPRQIINISAIKTLTDTTLTLENGFVIESSKVAKLMSGCSKLICFVVTIGPKLEQKRDYLIEHNESSQALILDACGSEAAESLAQTLNDSLIKDYRSKGFTLTQRYSPGYGDWHIKAQKDLLEFLNAGQIGVKLTGSFIMSPEKSVSAIIGLREN